VGLSGARSSASLVFTWSVRMKPCTRYWTMGSRRCLWAFALCRLRRQGVRCRGTGTMSYTPRRYPSGHGPT
jgi:hypothetical protein